MGFELNKSYSGFRLTKKEEIAEIKSLGLFFEHDVTGAELLVLENDDDNKVFSATFRTPPENDTGIAHILEHSVLCGSKNFPVKEPFVELMKGSLQTFLNAMTFPDKTYFHVITCASQMFIHYGGAILLLQLITFQGDKFRVEGGLVGGVDGAFPH